MNISIAVHYIANGNKVLQRGTFPVDYKRYKDNEQLEAARVAKKFIDSIDRQMGRIEVEKVLYNGDIDITNLVN